MADGWACHRPQAAFVDKWVAEKQAHWLEKVLAEEHEREPCSQAYSAQ